jgi:hypothetical protein
LAALNARSRCQAVKGLFKVACSADRQSRPVSQWHKRNARKSQERSPAFVLGKSLRSPRPSWGVLARIVGVDELHIGGETLQEAKQSFALVTGKVGKQPVSRAKDETMMRSISATPTTGLPINMDQYHRFLMLDVNQTIQVIPVLCSGINLFFLSTI